MLVVVVTLIVLHGACAQGPAEKIDFSTEIQKFLDALLQRLSTTIAPTSPIALLRSSPCRTTGADLPQQSHQCRHRSVSKIVHVFKQNPALQRDTCKICTAGDCVPRPSAPDMEASIMTRGWSGFFIVTGAGPSLDQSHQPESMEAASIRVAQNT